MPVRKRNQQGRSVNGAIPLPPFVSTTEEIRRAVERGAIHRGELLIKVIVSLRIDEKLEILRTLEYDKEDIHEKCSQLNIDQNALIRLDNNNPPIPYPFYFSTPEFLIEHPELVMYYRNVAMLSRKVMRGIGLPTDSQEDRNIPPSFDFAEELSRYFNGIVSKLVMVSKLSSNRHLEISLSNMGDAMGGISRNEVGRHAASQIISFLITYWFNLGYIKSVSYTLKNTYGLDDEEDSNFGVPNTLLVTTDTDIKHFLINAEKRRVKFQEIVLSNGFSLKLDKQLRWITPSLDKSYKFGVDMVSSSSSIDLFWGGEIKGGADPAGSDEHWKTATQTLNRVLEAAEKTNRLKPKFSFIATILVERVAREAQQWITEGKLTSVYNITKIIENPEELQHFQEEMTIFLGYIEPGK